MSQRALRAVPWLVAACLTLGGCADLPDSGGMAQAPAFDPGVFQRDLQGLKTSDPDEIRRRFGVYELLVGDVFVSHDGNPVALSEYRWIVPGALVGVDYMNCYEQTRKCDEGSFWVQYDAAQKRLNFLNAGNGVAWAHADVQPDGTLKVSRPSGAPYEIGFDFDKDEGLFSFPSLNRTSRYIPTERNQFAEVRKQWKQVNAETRAEEQRIAQERAAEQAAQRRREEREAEAERWNNINRAIAGMGQAYRETADQHRRNQADVAARNARLASSMQSSRPSSTTSAPRTVIPSTATLNRPTATTLAPSALTPLPSGNVPRTVPSQTSSRTPVPLKTNPLQPPRLSEQTLVAPQQPQQGRAPASSTTLSAPARVEKPIGPPGTTITVPRRETAPRPAPTVVASAPPSQRESERDRDPGKASTRDDPNRCISGPIEAKPVIGSAPKCQAFQVYNRCSAPVDIRTCVYLTVGKKWSCELRTVAPNAYKQHESCSPHRERFVSVKYADDFKTRAAMPPER